MTLTKQVAEAVIKAKIASTQQVRQWFPQADDQCVRGALYRACEYGWIRQVSPAGRGRKAEPAQYAGIEILPKRRPRKSTIRRCASVFDLANALRS